jgi:hypothetical protein
MQWFKHDADASTDAKIKKLLLRYGAIGYAVYFHCVELIVSDISETNITFELEHDSEIIADNLKIKGTAGQSGVDIVNEVMRYIVELGLFENYNGHITCYKILKRLDTSMTSNPKFRAIISEAKRENHDSVMILSSSSHDEVMQDEIRRDEKRSDKNIQAPSDAEPAGRKKAVVRHAYGSQANIYLSDDEKARLIEELGDRLFAECIEFYSLYKVEKGYKSKSDNLSIRRWVVDAVKQRKAPQRSGGSFGGKPPVIEMHRGKPVHLTEEEKRRQQEEYQKMIESQGLV